MTLRSFRGWLCIAVSIALLTTVAQAGELLLIDLTTTNQVTITATDGLAEISTSGSSFTGVYFENFYSGAGNSLSATLVSGDLTNAENPSDGTPSLFRGDSGADPGLNLWSWSSDGTVSFTVDTVAFVGSATWDLTPEAYSDMLAGSTVGNLYFPADTEDDIASADMLGTYRVIPEPATLALLGISGLALIRRR